MKYLRQTTAATLTIGPFIDLAGTSRETALTLSQTDIKLSKNGGAFASKSNAATCTHMWQGHYACPINGTDSNTAGRVTLAASDGAALAVWHEYMVLPAQVYDSMVTGNDYLQVDAEQIGGVAHTAATIGTVARVNSVVTGTIGTVAKVTSVTSGTVATAKQVTSVVSGTIAAVAKVTSVTSGTIATVGRVSSVVSGTIAKVGSVTSGTIGKVASVTSGTIATVGQVSSVVSGTIAKVGVAAIADTSLTSGAYNEMGVYTALAAWDDATAPTRTTTGGTLDYAKRVASVVSGTVHVTGNVTTAATSNTAIATAVLGATAYSESAGEFTTSGVLSRLLAKARNKRVVKSDTEIVYKDDGSTPWLTHTLATVSGTFTRGEAT